MDIYLYDRVPWRGGIMMRAYSIGFLGSVVLTVIAFVCVQFKLLEGLELLLVIGGLAALQAVVQLYYFMHLGSEEKPRIKLITFLFMFIILLIIVGGSIWIMHHLNYNMMEMTPSEKDYYMNTQRDKGF
jgi:cytochrome o ubiquinol oxidase operon protein cyoD